MKVYIYLLSAIALVIINACQPSPVGTIYFDNGRSLEVYQIGLLSHTNEFGFPAHFFGTNYQDENYSDYRSIPYSDIKSIEVIRFYKYKYGVDRYDLRIITRKTNTVIELSVDDFQALNVKLHDGITDRIIDQSIEFKIPDGEEYKLNIKKIVWK